MSLPVLAAVTGAPWEAALVSALEGSAAGLTVVRRCVDLPDLLAAASAGTARAALVSAGLRRLDRDALARLHAAGVTVVGLYTPGDELGEISLRRLGVAHVLPADTDPAELAVVVASAVHEQPVRSGAAAHAYSQPVSAAGLDGRPAREDLGPDDAAPPDTGEEGAGRGRLVAVWGPTGAPGRTTVATGLAAALARRGVPTLLADADVYGGVIAQLLGLLDEAPGLAAAARLANNGTLDLPGLARVAPVVAPELRVLTGIARAQRWPELRPAALEQVWALARQLATVTVADCGFCLEQDEELSFDTAAPRRNGATLATLADADVVLAVGAADPVGVARLVRGLEALRETVPGVAPRVVLNRFRRSAVGGPDPAGQLLAALERYAGVRDAMLLPEDRESLDAALVQGRVVPEVAADSPAGRALAALAERLAHEVLGDPAGAAATTRVTRRPRGLLRKAP